MARRPKPKYLLRDIRSREPALADVVHRIGDTSAPRRERWELLDALVHEVLQHVGGPVVESETTRMRVDPEPVIAHIEGLTLHVKDSL